MQVPPPTVPVIVRTFAIALLALLLLPRVSAAQEDSPALSTRLTAPARVGDFRLVSSRQLEGGAGGQLHYRIPAGMEVDAFVAPLPVIPSCRRACDSVAVDAEADSFAVLGEIDSLRVERDTAFTLDLPGGPPVHGRHLRLLGSVGGKPVRSHLLLYGTGSYLVRVRATFAPSAKRDSLTELFGREFIRAATRPAGGASACTGGTADQEAMRLTADSRSGIAEVRRKAEALLAGLGFTLDPKASRADSLWTVPLQGWPAGIDYGAWARERSPGFVVGVLLAERPGGTRITVSAQAVCQARFGTEDPKSLELALELRTAGQVLGKLEPGPRRP